MPFSTELYSSEYSAFSFSFLISFWASSFVMPTKLGRVTFSLPMLIVALTTVPFSTLVSASGSCSMTLSAVTLSLISESTIMYSSPLSCTADSASCDILLIISGTSASLENAPAANDVKETAIRTTTATASAITTFSQVGNAPMSSFFFFSLIRTASVSWVSSLLNCRADCVLSSFSTLSAFISAT